MDPQIASIILDEPIVSIPDGDEDEDDGYNLGEDSYFAWDISMWECQGLGRDPACRAAGRLR